MEKIYRVPSEYHHRVLTGKPKWKLWLRFFLAFIPPGLITHFLSPYIPDRWEPWGSVSFMCTWIFFILMLPVFKDMFRWNRHVGMADSGTYWILGDDTLTVIDEETDKPSQVVHRSDISVIMERKKELAVFTKERETVWIPRVVERFDELYDHLNTWKFIEPLPYYANKLSLKQQIGIWLWPTVLVLIVVSLIANILTGRLLPTIIFSSITLIGSLSFIVLGYLASRLTGEGSFWEVGLEFILIMLITLAKLALVIYVEL